MFKELFEEESIDVEEALYQSGYEWDVEKKGTYKIYLNKDTKTDFIKQLKRLGKISYSNEKLNIQGTAELISKLLK